MRQALPGCSTLYCAFFSPPSRLYWSFLVLKPPPTRRTRNVLERRKNQCVLWIRFLRSLRRFGIGVGHIIVYCCSSACVCHLGDIRFKCSEVTRTCTIVSDDGWPGWAEEIKFLVSRSEGRRDIDSFSARSSCNSANREGFLRDRISSTER